MVDFARLFRDAGCEGSVHALRLADGLDVGHDHDRVQVMASVVKVPIALESYAQVAERRLDPAHHVTVTPHDSTPGPVGISRFQDAVTASLRDLTYLMLTISDNAATDAVSDVVGIDAVNARLQAAGCHETLVVSDLRGMLDDVARDLGFTDYRRLLQAQTGQLGSAAETASTDPARIDRCRALDPLTATRTTARDATRLLAGIWGDTAAPPEACAALRAVMAEQLTRRLGPAVIDGGSIAAKSGGLFGRIRNEIAVVTDPDETEYAVAIFTRALRPFARHQEINHAMATVATVAIDRLRREP